LLVKIKRAIKSSLKRLYATFLRPIIRHRLPEKVRRTLLADLTITQPDIMSGGQLSSHRSTPAFSPFSDTSRLLLAYLKMGFAPQMEYRGPTSFCTEDHAGNLSRVEPMTGGALRDTLNHALSAEGSLEQQGFDLDYGVRLGFNQEFKAEVLSISSRVAEIPFIQCHIGMDVERVLFAGRYPSIVPLQLASSSNTCITVVHERKFPYRHSRIEPIIGTLESIAFDDNVFDVVTYCFSGTEGLYDREKSLKNVFRFAKSDGRVLFTFPFGFGETVQDAQRITIEEVLSQVEASFASRDVSISSYNPKSREWQYEKYTSANGSGLKGNGGHVLLFFGSKR
jgi:SAM-dependent methyltransferase